MANDNKNDIVVSAQANTKQAEANLKKLDAQIKTLSNSNPKLQQLGRELGSVGDKAGKAASTGINSSKAVATGFSALQGSLTGVLTKLGAIGLAIAAVKVVWDSLSQAQQRQIDHLNMVADANEKYVSALQGQTKDLLGNLEEMNKLAEDGYLDNASIQQTNNLVAQLNSLWGDVGITVDQTTGKVSGLAEATKKINGELREMALEGAKARQEAAKLALDKAKQDKRAEYNEDGSMTLYGATKAATNVDNLTGFYLGGMSADDIRSQRERELDAKVKEQEAAFLAAQAEVKRLETNTTQEALDAAKKEAEEKKKKAEEEKRKREEEERKQAEADRRLAAQRRSLREVDVQEVTLRQNLSIAQATGGDVEGAKAALDNYTQQRDKARFTELQGQIEQDKQRQREAQERYEVGLRHGDTEEISRRLEDLKDANETLEAHTAEMARIASGVYKPAEAPATEITRSMSNGTFDAYGLGGLVQDKVEEQQLEVQRQIARNTENLNVPIVGE